MAEHSTITAAVIVSAAILLHGYWVSHGGQPAFQLSAAGSDGRTVWRMDSATGRLSLCGSMLNGGAFSQMQAQQDAAMVKAAQSGSKSDVAAIVNDSQALSTAADVRCTEWPAS